MLETASLKNCDYILLLHIYCLLQWLCAPTVAEAKEHLFLNDLKMKLWAEGTSFLPPLSMCRKNETQRPGWAEEKYDSVETVCKFCCEIPLWSLMMVICLRRSSKILISCLGGAFVEQLTVRHRRYSDWSKLGYAAVGNTSTPHRI